MDAISRDAYSLVRVARLTMSKYLEVVHGIEIRGREHWPRSGPLVVTSNHPTYLDPWIVGIGADGARRYVHWMAWDEIFEWPIVGRAVTAYQAIPVDLEKPRPSTFRRANAVLARGGVLGVFPEGGRTSGEHGEIDPFKPGVARLALALGAPILPVSIKGARQCWPKQRAYPLPGKIRVTFHPVVDTRAVLEAGDKTEKRARELALVARLEATIRSAL